jgi:1,4-alpha-glucan branching enzyme
MTTGSLAHERVLRLLVLTADYEPAPWSGIGVAVARQTRALADANVDVTVLVSGRKRPVTIGRRLRVMPLPTSAFPVRPDDYDLVHVHSLQLAALAEELCARFALPLVSTVHGWPHVECPGDDRAARWSAVQRRLLRRSDRVVFLSRAERALGLTEVPDVAMRAALIPHAVAAAPVRPADRRGGPVIFAGRFAASKGIDLLTETLGLLLASRGIEAVIAGGHGDAAGHDAVATLAARFPGRCHVPGWLDRTHLASLVARASVALVPSVYEPFGMTALDALHAGTPLIAADTGGLSDIVEPGGGGVRLASRDAGDWWREIESLLDDVPRARRLSAEGPAQVERRFPAGPLAAQLLADIYVPAITTAGTWRTRRCS